MHCPVGIDAERVARDTWVSNAHGGASISRFPLDFVQAFNPSFSPYNRCMKAKRLLSAVISWMLSKVFCRK
jgi:hypothetical protein